MEAERGEPSLPWAAQLHQPADARIRAIYEKRIPWAALRSALQQKLDCIYATVKPNLAAFDAWQRLLTHLGYRTSLLSVAPVIARIGPQAGNTALDALLLFALRHQYWVRTPEAWLSTSPFPRAQIGSLARHLFARYDVPAFMDTAWFEGFTPEGSHHRSKQRPTLYR